MTEKAITEDISYLKKWLIDAEKLAVLISKKSKSENLLSVFTISTTRKIAPNRNPYLTPVRKIIHGYVGGSVVFSQTQALILAKKIDGLVDQILVDVEKKIGITVGVEKKTFKEFNIKIPNHHNLSREHIEMGNLSSVCSFEIKKSRFHEYKPNDLTVESAWFLLSEKFKILSGKKIAILGAGNIGFKLALKLVESGCKVNIVRRNEARGHIITNTINIIKPKDTVANANFELNPLKASLFTDVLIGCTDGYPIINWKMIQSMNPKGIIIDIGKGSIEKEAVKKSIKNNISIFRCDISSGIDGVISTIERNNQIVNRELGRIKSKEGFYFVSGGMLGKDGDIVVDYYKNPKQIFGIADGAGDLKKNLSLKEKNLIKKLKAII